MEETTLSHVADILAPEQPNDDPRAAAARMLLRQLAKSLRKHQTMTNITHTQLLDAVAKVAESGLLAQRAGPADSRLVCAWCQTPLEADGRQPHEDFEGAPCPIGIIENAVLDHQGRPRRAEVTHG